MIYNLLTFIFQAPLEKVAQMIVLYQNLKRNIILHVSSQPKTMHQYFSFCWPFLRFVKDMPYALSDKEARLSEPFFPWGR